jgi:hypothetical protein
VFSVGLQSTDVDYVNAHATSTPAGDMAEYRAIRGVMPHDQLRMNSTKSMIGHLLGGAGAVEAVATIKAIETGDWQVAGQLNSKGNCQRSCKLLQLLLRIFMSLEKPCAACTSHSLLPGSSRAHVKAVLLSI